MARDGVEIGPELIALYQAYSNSRCKAVWSHGAVFGIPIVEHYLRESGLLAPWKFWDIRDTRTLFWAATARGWKRRDRPTAHTALADAVVQAEDVCSAWAFITA
jgi:hypothetical protein